MFIFPDVVSDALSARSDHKHPKFQSHPTFFTSLSTSHVTHHHPPLASDPDIISNNQHAVSSHNAVPSLYGIRFLCDGTRSFEIGNWGLKKHFHRVSSPQVSGVNCLESVYLVYPTYRCWTVWDFLGLFVLFRLFVLNVGEFLLMIGSARHSLRVKSTHLECFTMAVLPESMSRSITMKPNQLPYTLSVEPSKTLQPSSQSITYNPISRELSPPSFLLTNSPFSLTFGLGELH